MFDIIGDIHGYNSKLEALLTKMGYRKQSGTWKHPERKAIFVGDYIDRGPEIRETLHLVRNMVEADAAIALMGNHEYNALAYHTPDGTGGFLRKHIPHKTNQHSATLNSLIKYCPNCSEIVCNPINFHSFLKHFHIEFF